MKVKDLIKQLQKMPQNANVMYYDGDNGWVTPSIEVRENPPVSGWHPNGAKLHGTIIDLTAD